MIKRKVGSQKQKTRWCNCWLLIVVWSFKLILSAVGMEGAEHHEISHSLLTRTMAQCTERHSFIASTKLESNWNTHISLCSLDWSPLNDKISFVVKLRQGSGKERPGKLELLPRAYTSWLPPTHRPPTTRSLILLN